MPFSVLPKTLLWDGCGVRTAKSLIRGIVNHLTLRPRPLSVRSASVVRSIPWLWWFLWLLPCSEANPPSILFGSPSHAIFDLGSGSLLQLNSRAKNVLCEMYEMRFSVVCVCVAIA